MRADGMRVRVARVYRPKAGTHRWFDQHPNHVRRTHAIRRLGAIRDSRLTRAVVDAARRRPSAGLIFHRDRGSELLGTTCRARLTAGGVRQRMTRGGAPGEHAHRESFCHSLKADVIHGRRFQSVADLRQQPRRYVRYYNHQRLHSVLDDQSPVDYERRAA